MSSLNPPYVTYIYQPRHPLTWKWLDDLLCKLWMRGITFSQDIPPKVSWKEELQTTAFRLQGSHAATLEEALKESLVNGSLYLTLWDGDLEYDLCIDPNNDSERKELESNHEDMDVNWLAEQEEEFKKRETVGSIILYCDMSRKYHLYGQNLVQVKEMPYLRAYRGHLHWSKVLCEILNPLFALGDVRSELSEDEHLRIWEQVARGELPSMAYCLQKKAFCYLPAREITVEQLTQVLAVPRCSFEILHSGGAFFSVSHTPFCYEENRAQLQILQGEDLFSLEPPEARPLTEEVVKEREKYFQQALQQEDLEKIKRSFQRALTIYTMIKDTSGISTAEYLLRRLEKTLEEKQCED